jgi:hypothetical protein
MTLQPFVGPWPLSFLIFLHSRYDSLDGESACRKATTHIQDSTNTEQTHTDIHTLSGIRNHDPSVWAGKDISCLRSRGHCDRHWLFWCSKISPSSVSRYEYKHRMASQKSYGVGTEDRQAERTQSFLIFHPCPLQPPSCLPFSSFCDVVRLGDILHRAYTLWHVDPLLGNDSEISRYTIAVAR